MQQTQKKPFDPRSNRVLNPFVQAYLEKQEEGKKPLTERQKVINLLLLFGLALNLTVMGFMAIQMRHPQAQAVGQPSLDDAVTMGEAMDKIRQLDAALQTMRTNVEFHRNAYYKLEQDHETLRSAIAQSMPVSGEKEMASIYATKSIAAQPLPNQQLESAEAQEALKQAQIQATQHAPEQTGGPNSVALKAATAAGQ